MSVPLIDLLSSSPQLPPPRPIISKPAPTSRVSKKAADEWIAVSSDDGRPPLPTLASEKPNSAAATRNIVASATVAKSSSSKPGPALIKGHNDIQFLSDDFDSTMNFDSSITKLDDDPFASDPPLPPTKKRRVSVSPQPAKRTSGGFERTKTNGSAAFDEITFTSSPDHIAEATKRRRNKYNYSRKDDLEEEAKPDVRQNVIKSSKFQGTGCSFSDLDEFETLEGSEEDLLDLASIPKAVKSSGISKSTDSQRALDKYNTDKAKDKAMKEKLELEDKAAKEKLEKAKEKLDKSKEKLDKAKDKTEKAKEKAAAKEAEKEAKRKDKEKKASERKLATELAKVNTLKTDKKVSTPEMIVDLPTSLDSILLEQTYKLLHQHGVEHTNWESELPVVKWRRKIVATYNEEAGHWEPTKLHIKEEKHIMCVITAQVLVDLISGTEGHDLDAHAIKLKAKFEHCAVIYLVEGFMAWMKKNKTLLNREYTAAFRSHQNGAPTASQKKKKKKAEYVNEDLIEDALLRLQIHHNTFIHHTNAMVETAEWILHFTQHISSIPYKTQRDSLDTGFCMDTGQVKTGDDAADTYVRMLQEVFRVTAPIAYGIVAEHPTLRELVTALEEQGPLALEDCRKSTNKDGAFSDKRIGPAISKKIHKVFTEGDPGVWIV